MTKYYNYPAPKRIIRNFITKHALGVSIFPSPGSSDFEGLFIHDHPDFSQTSRTKHLPINIFFVNKCLIFDIFKVLLFCVQSIQSNQSYDKPLKDICG